MLLICKILYASKGIPNIYMLQLTMLACCEQCGTLDGAPNVGCCCVFHIPTDDLTFAPFWHYIYTNYDICGVMKSSSPS